MKIEINPFSTLWPNLVSKLYECMNLVILTNFLKFICILKWKRVKRC